MLHAAMSGGSGHGLDLWRLSQGQKARAARPLMLMPRVAARLRASRPSRCRRAGSAPARGGRRGARSPRRRDASPLPWGGGTPERHPPRPHRRQGLSATRPEPDHPRPGGLRELALEPQPTRPVTESNPVTSRSRSCTGRPCDCRSRTNSASRWSSGSGRSSSSRATRPSARGRAATTRTMSTSASWPTSDSGLA